MVLSGFSMFSNAKKIAVDEIRAAARTRLRVTLDESTTKVCESRGKYDESTTKVLRTCDESAAKVCESRRMYDESATKVLPRTRLRVTLDERATNI